MGASLESFASSLGRQAVLDRNREVSKNLAYDAVHLRLMTNEQAFELHLRRHFAPAAFRARGMCVDE